MYKSKKKCITLKINKIEKPLDINRDGGVFSGFGGSDGIGGTDGTSGIEPKKIKPKSSTRKYKCLCCDNSFRATKDLNVLCMDCNVQFVKVEN